MIKKCKRCAKKYILVGTKYELDKFIFCTKCISEMKETRIGRKALRKKGIG